MKLLSAEELERSSVVANCSMNRERQLRGSNSYARDLSFDVASFLQDRAKTSPACWLDVCCGMGRALIEAAEEFPRQVLRSAITLEGIDLAGHFAAHSCSNLVLQKISIEDWAPTCAYDLVTCVHGLHYVGDKLAAIAKLIRCLKPNGQFLANLDLANVYSQDGQPVKKLIAALMRREKLEYDFRRRLIKCTGPRDPHFDLAYLGADDAAGPNYTRQPAVNSYYTDLLCK